jgi:putative membrane protein
MWNAAVGLTLVGFAVWAIVTTGQSVMALGAASVRALWVLPGLLALHLLQLFLSARSWQCVLPPGPALLRLYRLRITREGIDSMLPVAQVGGEIIGAKLLAADGLLLAVTAASVVVDVTLEFLTQLIFLLIGVAALAMISPDGAWQAWIGAAVLTGAGGVGLLAAQRFGLLRILETLARHIAARWPGVGALTGLDAAAAAMYRSRSSMLQAGSLHLLAWLLGSLESWAVLNAIGTGTSLTQAMAIEALGMAARSAGFAVPGALVVQETGFALAAAAVGLPEASGLSLSLVKRAREVCIGLLGLALWRLERR